MPAQELGLIHVRSQWICVRMLLEKEKEGLKSSIARGGAGLITGIDSFFEMGYLQRPVALIGLPDFRGR